MAQGIEAAYVVLAGHGKHMALASVATTILWLMLLGLVGVAIYGFIIANSLMEPIEHMEDGILAVINGRSDVRLEVETPELGGLAYRVNQLINMLMGVAEEDEEGRAVTSSGGWEAVSASGPDAGARSSSSGDPYGDDPEAAALAAVPEGQYYARLYQDYVAAKRSVGDDVTSVAEERFIERIKGNADHLVKKHSAKMVRFKVETIGGQVNLRPVIIR
jgi:hypothetical protein